MFEFNFKKYLNPAPSLLLKQYIFRFQVTVYQSIFIKQIQTKQHWIGEFSNQLKISIKFN